MLLLINLSLVLVRAVITMKSSTSYIALRNELLFQEKTEFLGSKLNLSENELVVNQALLGTKLEELKAGHKNTADFLPSLHFFQAKERIDKSPVFHFIRNIPKGASLHTHLLAAVSVDFLMKNVSHREHLFGGYVNGIFKLKFLNGPTQDIRCNWTSIREMRATDHNFDQWLHNQLSLWVPNPRETYPNPETIWLKFKKIFTTMYDLISYRPVFEEYLQHIFLELHEDHIMYTELKGTIMPLYELDGSTYSKEQFFEVFIQAVEKFKLTHPKFRGAKYIHSIYRGVGTETLQEALDELIRLKQKFPSFIAGFDFVGFEEEGYSLSHFSTELLTARKHLNFFFHAGETNWFGHTDLNLADAILMNSSRIGHGFAIVKHPQLLHLARERNIPLEICPVSNQVLMLNQDPRNHPAAQLMALDYPIVIGNDDPALWNATGLSYDWYVAFMAMTSKDCGLEVLKQFAINSIIYSCLTSEEKSEFLEEWNQQWDLFIQNTILYV